MQVFRYSGPQFDLYGDEVRQGDDGAPPPWAAPTASGPLDARVALPGSKSLTNRELVLAALADGPSLLRAPLLSRDTELMVQALRALGTTVEEVPGHDDADPDLRVTPGELEGGTSVDCGLAGTVMRFLPPVAALALGPVAFDGDEAARRRPMRATIDALRGLGVDVGDDGRGALPFSVHGTGSVAGGEVVIDASASSQFVSGLLLAAPRFDEGLVLRHSGGDVPSSEHIAMTLAVLARRGVRVETPEAGVWVVPAAPIRALDVAIEPDLSNAAPFLAAAAAVGGSVTVTGWPRATTQVGARVPGILERMGAEVGVTPVDDATVDLTVSGTGALRGIELADAGELAPTFAALAALAEGETVLTGLAHLRGHETDRLAALAAEIGALGGDATETDDGLVIRPRPLSGGLWHAHADHRMATAGALIGLVVPGVEVDDIAATRKTLPRFAELWSERLLGRRSGPVDPLLVF